MTKHVKLKFGPRDDELLSALQYAPFTAVQLLALSETFVKPFQDKGTLSRRLRDLTRAGLVRSFPYAVGSLGRSPFYFKLTRKGYRKIYGKKAPLPSRRYFEAISDGDHRHTQALADFVVHLLVSAHRSGIEMLEFTPENSVTIETDFCRLRPDCTFQLVMPDGRAFNFAVELDNGTERVRSKKIVESIERKIRGYDQHQRGLKAFDPEDGLPFVAANGKRYRRRATAVTE